MARAKIIFPRMDLELADASRLPKRRGQVLELAARGLSSKKIGLELGISSETVDWHLNELKDQLCAFSRADLISQGWMHGLLKARAAIRTTAFLLAVISLMPMIRNRAPRASTQRPAASAMRIGRREISEIYG